MQYNRKILDWLFPTQKKFSGILLSMAPLQLSLLSDGTSSDFVHTPCQFSKKGAVQPPGSRLVLLTPIDKKGNTPFDGTMLPLVRLLE